jgi:hypothetical protein
MRGAIMPAGPFFAYFLWANKESKRGMIAFKNSESNPQLTLTFLHMQIRQQALSLLPLILSAVEELGKQKSRKKKILRKEVKVQPLNPNSR